MYAALLTGAIALTTLIDSDGWRYTGAIQGELNGQSETIQLLYAPPLFALAIPETEATPAGLLVISEFDLSPLGFFRPFPFHIGRWRDGASRNWFLSCLPMERV